MEFSTPFLYYQQFVASNPSTILIYQNQELKIIHNQEEYCLKIQPKFALEFIQDLNHKLKSPFTENDQKHYQYGLVGYFSFEFGLKLQGNKLDQKKLLEQKIPDFYFMLPTQIDYLDSDLNVIETQTVKTEQKIFTTPQDNKTNAENQDFKSNLTEKQYLQKLETIKQLLINGETYQVNFAQRWKGSCKKLPTEIFKLLTKLNPSKHQALLQTSDFSIISNSPESLFIKTKDSLKTYPIKGTLSKSEDPQKLLDSLKDQSELEMIVDLERNDLGKIAKTGTVKVTNHRYIETYSNLHHTLSEISCTLKPKTTFSQIIQSIFPGGSVTGCPKHRTSQFIHDLEPNLREYYCGSLGYLDTSGNSQFNILIRTVLITHNNNQAYFHSGGGITIQSNPTEEYQETLLKAANLIKALS